MDLDKSWHRNNEVAQDVYNDLIRKEQDLSVFGDYNASSHLTPFRRRIVDWMLLVNKNLEENRPNNHRVSYSQNRRHILQSNLRAIHLAIHLFDNFLNENCVVPGNVFLVAATAIIVAAKFEILHSYVPTPKVLNQYIQADQRKVFRMENFLLVERLLLQNLDWRLHIPLALDFVDYYQIAFENVDAHSVALLNKSNVTPVFNHQRSIIEEQNIMACRRYSTPSPEPTERCFTNWKHLVDFLLNLTLKDVCFRQHRPSLLAGAVIYAARWYYSIKPYWTKRLTDISKYDLDELKPCVNNIVKLVEIERRLNASSFPPLFKDLFGVVDNAAIGSGCFSSPSVSPDVQVIGYSPDFQTPSSSYDLQQRYNDFYFSNSLNAPANPQQISGANNYVRNTPVLTPQNPYTTLHILPGLNDAEVSQYFSSSNYHQSTMQRIASVPLVARQQQNYYTFPPTIQPQSGDNFSGSSVNGMVFPPVQLIRAQDGTLFYVLQNSRITPLIAIPVHHSYENNTNNPVVNNVNFQQTILPSSDSSVNFQQTVLPPSVASSLDVIDLEPSPLVNMAIPCSASSTSICSNAEVCQRCCNYASQGQQRNGGVTTRNMKRTLNDGQTRSSDEYEPAYDCYQPSVKRSRRK